MADGVVKLNQRGWGQTSRTDAWWMQPSAVFVGLLAFLILANLRVFEGDYYFSGHSSVAANQTTNYLTPFYSPLMFEQPKYAERPSHHAWWSAKPGWLPSWVSPAALILIFPAGFRFTCYYYRGAYYKAFWADPPNCAVGEPRKGYLGENSLPLILQNIHRYFFYFAVAFLVVLAYDAWNGFWFNVGTHDAPQWRFGVGVGSLVLTLNVYLLCGYTLGCHSLRHLIGGRKDCVSENPLQHKLYQCVSCLNSRHMLWAWCSLVWVAFTDIYVRFVAKGAWTDLHFVF